MADAAARAEERRARILARGKDRLQYITGEKKRDEFVEEQPAADDTQHAHANEVSTREAIPKPQSTSSAAPKTTPAARQPASTTTTTTSSHSTADKPQAVTAKATKEQQKPSSSSKVSVIFQHIIDQGPLLLALAAAIFTSFTLLEANPAPIRSSYLEQTEQGIPHVSGIILAIFLVYFTPNISVLKNSNGPFPLAVLAFLTKCMRSTMRFIDGVTLYLVVVVLTAAISQLLTTPSVPEMIF
eukprot:TRINITY_DN15584_c0_g1::TRINITY_DN15584_c0_g1_i1::g.28566::m.28566 TRINITY_DN15584_c0_g1::TRINITY_DN15584_c0_g1_i1::g.28566  ORF type:complete len:242 (-),score=20.95,Med3/PF11593.3/0.00016,Mucin/PF01456.12/0.0017,CAML/PF14963.1/0.0046,DUF572/PF04502.8/0.17,Menin/PF05053.8/0.26,Lin-8/PF03353.10/0.58,Herpes_capsid/PF06112.6/1.4,DUF4551/PF15087.1/2.2,AIF-MLS/PF14962.1/11 TRINITY_DN15584_c0_g1_i1:5-730(-)